MMIFFEDLENIGIRDIIVTDDIFLICAFLIIPFGILLLLFTYIYNKVYIKNNQRDFLVFFFGEKGALLHKPICKGFFSDIIFK